jgi:AraC-like DNA-binding protein
MAQSKSEKPEWLKETSSVRTYRMSEASQTVDFEIRDETVRNPITTPHRHEFFQIHANLSGQGNHVIGGELQPFSDNSLIFILPYRIHFTPPPIPQHYLVINFASNFLRPDLTMTPFEMEESSIDDFPELAPFLFQGLLNFTFTKEQFTHIKKLLNEMGSLHSHRNMGALTRIRGKLLDLIGYTLECHHDQFQNIGQKQFFTERRTVTLDRAIRFIDEKLDTEITLKEVSENAFISPNYFSQLLKKRTGMAFVEWLTARRIERAKELLAYTSLRVFEVANKVGFSDQAYFSRRFSDRIGLSPLQYRKKMKKIPST